MTNYTNPLSKELLRKFVAGVLDDAENEKIMMRLADDEAGLEFVDALWQSQQARSAATTIPELNPERARQVRHRIMHQIHRSDLAMNVFKMGTKGFGSVALGLLRPLLDSKNWARKNRRRRRGND